MSTFRVRSFLVRQWDVVPACRYPYLGVSVVLPLSKLALIPGLSVEAAPETGRWGFVASLVADFPVAAGLGLDVDVTLLHDQPGADWRHAEFFLGAGVGLSIFLGRWTISPYTNVFRDLSADASSHLPVNFYSGRGSVTA